MTKLFLCAVLVVAMFNMVGSAVFAQSFNAGHDSGQTAIMSSLVGTKYTWTVFNISNQSFPAWDTLVWSLKPFNVKAPLSESYPAGWTWTGTDFEVNASGKYYTPPAIAPGKSITFTYTFDPVGPVINQDSNVPGGKLDFLSHVGPVVPGSGSLNGSTQWQAADADFGQGVMCSYYDHPAPVADSSTLNLAGVGAFGALGWFFRKKKHR